MPMIAPTSPPQQLQRIEELGRIILAYSEVTERLERSHEQLVTTLAALRAELTASSAAVASAQPRGNPPPLPAPIASFNF